MRYNIFNNIHKALRYQMYEASSASAVYDCAFTEKNEATIFTRIRETLQFMADHGQHENDFIIPAIAIHDAASAIALGHFHRQNLLVIKKMREQMMAWEQISYGDERMVLATAIHGAFLKFIADNVQQMEHEESAINKVLWLHYTDAEIMQLFEGIARSIAPAHVREISRLMMNALTNAEITAWLTMVKQQAPAPTFDYLLNLAEKQLTLHRWEQIKSSLVDGVQCLP